MSIKPSFETQTQTRTETETETDEEDRCRDTERGGRLTTATPGESICTKDKISGQSYDCNHFKAREERLLMQPSGWALTREESYWDQLTQDWQTKNYPNYYISMTWPATSALLQQPGCAPEITSQGHRGEGLYCCDICLEGVNSLWKEIPMLLQQGVVTPPPAYCCCGGRDFPPLL